MTTRQCSVCDQPHLALGYCLKHYKRFKSHGDALHPSAQDVLTTPEGLRVCSRCTEAKPLDDFGKNARYKDGRLRICKVCMKTKVREWCASNKEHATREGSRRNALSKYGTGGEQAWRKIEAGAVCDACGKRRPRMAIDHDHETGRVRGILCSPCNTSLGLLREDPERFAALLGYLITSSAEASCGS